MLLAVDIGNSSIGLGLFENDTLTFTAKMAADTKRSAQEYAVTVQGLLTAQGKCLTEVSSVIISSVVPMLTHTVEAALLWANRDTPLPMTIVGSGVKTGIHLKVDDPSVLGADIVTNATSAVKTYGAPVLVVDIGTATVISCVDEQKALVGVAIAPGPISAQEGLHQNAALLPLTELSTCPAPLGKSTAAALRAGIVLGHACMLDGMIGRIIDTYHLPANTPVVVTGGLANLVIPACTRPMTYQENLTLWGLYHIYTATTQSKRS